uniref:Uncharacterized protein n=1 Tax=Meloidogyne javanica TaxID=6303 RepID=A0A915MGH5_MELJA
MKLILLVFIQMCLIPLVLSDAKRPEKPQPCGDEYDECPPGYKCEYDNNVVGGEIALETVSGVFIHPHVTRHNVVGMEIAR